MDSSTHASAASMRRYVRRFRFLYLNPKLWRRRASLWLAAILIGIAAVILAKGSHLLHDAFYYAYDKSPYWSLLITPAGLFLSVWLLRRYFPGAEGSGIPQAIAALDPRTRGLRQRWFTLKAAFGKMVLTLLGIASGATFGYEGPIVQIGATIKYSFDRAAAITHEGTARRLIQAGGAAGIAAAFNTPLAGIVFALEEMGRTIDQRAGRIILLSVILASLTSLVLIGNYTYFGVTRTTLPLDSGWRAILLTGLIGGLIGGGTAKLLMALSAQLPGPFEAWRSAYPLRFAICCGLLIAVIGIACHGSTFGTGYYRASEIISGRSAGLEHYGIAKLATLILSYVSGAPGGMFAPSLAVGAGFGLNLSHLFPGLPQTALILLGMVAFFAGLTRAPMTGFVIVMEMTNSSEMVIPLMAAALIAANISRILSRQTLYGGQAKALLQEMMRKQEPLNADTASATKHKNDLQYPSQ